MSSPEGTDAGPGDPAVDAVPAPGGDPVAERRAAAPAQPLGLWWLSVVGLGVAGILLVTSNLRAYGYAVGVTLGVLALLRATLPERALGGLVVRGRWLDVATLAALGAAIAVLASTLRLADL